MSRRKFAWASLPDEQLLEVRLKDLRVTLEGTWLEDCLHNLHDELEERGIRVRPHAWISSEWFSPDTTPGIAIPFYLTHPRLMRLEKKMIIDVEGGTWSECMSILRHEAGHVVQHAYQLHRRRRWRQLFGPTSKRYPRYYRPNPASRHFVQHLRLWYAQSHPDEDFAETFAVWLRPRSNWRTALAWMIGLALAATPNCVAVGRTVLRSERMYDVACRGRGEMSASLASSSSPKLRLLAPFATGFPTGARLSLP